MNILASILLGLIAWLCVSGVIRHIKNDDDEPARPIWAIVMVAGLSIGFCIYFFLKGIGAVE